MPDKRYRVMLDKSAQKVASLSLVPNGEGTNPPGTMPYLEATVGIEENKKRAVIQVFPRGDSASAEKMMADEKIADGIITDIVDRLGYHHTKSIQYAYKAVVREIPHEYRKKHFLGIKW